jgi:hypothetical protein
MTTGGNPTPGCATTTRAVALPFALDRKYRNAATEWAWQFVFPAGRICRDPRWGPPSRFHLHETVVQREIAAAARKAGLTKKVGAHTFRHFVRDGAVAGGVRHSDRAGDPRPRGRQHDNDLHARPQPWRAGCAQPARPALNQTRAGGHRSRHEEHLRADGRRLAAAVVVRSRIAVNGRSQSGRSEGSIRAREAVDLWATSRPRATRAFARFAVTACGRSPRRTANATRSVQLRLSLSS